MKRDDLNIRHIFQGTDTQLLVDALGGKINLYALAQKELKRRGLDKNGWWTPPWDVEDDGTTTERCPKGWPMPCAPCAAGDVHDR